MSSRDFCYWLQGFSEIDGHLPNERQWLIILDHLNEVEGFPKKEVNPLHKAIVDELFSNQLANHVIKPSPRRIC